MYGPFISEELLAKPALRSTCTTPSSKKPGGSC
jgi:hypothetical protein